jgi:hypothetical protein
MNLEDSSTKNTLTVKSGGGGLHLFYLYPDFKIGNKVRSIPGCDVRSDNGFVVTAPSHHASGNNYEIINDSPIGPCPEWLNELLKSPPPKERSGGRRTFDQRFEEGTRNDSLFKIAVATHTKT